MSLSSARKLRTAHASSWQCSAGLKCLRASNAVGRVSQASCLIASASKVTGPDTRAAELFPNSRSSRSVLSPATIHLFGSRNPGIRAWLGFDELLAPASARCKCDAASTACMVWRPVYNGLPSSRTFFFPACLGSTCFSEGSGLC